MRPGSWWRKTGERGSLNSVRETLRRQSSRVHTHPGTEGWFVLAGEQCLRRRLAPTGLRLEELWSSMIQLNSGAFSLTGNRPEPVVGNIRNQQKPRAS